MRVNNILPDVIIQWRFLNLKDEGWKSLRCVYAYLAPDEKEILYIGKAWGVTVRARWNRSGKEKFWDRLEKEKQIFEHLTILGSIRLTYNGKLTSKLLSDIESLLIMGEQPWGNEQCKKSRISRPGLIVKCVGKWPGKARFYKDSEQ